MSDLTHAISAMKVQDSTDLCHPARLVLETAGVAAGTLAIVRFLFTCPTIRLTWLLIPCTLVIAAMMPTWIARRDFPRIGLHAEPIRLALRTVGLAVLCLAPPVYLGLWLLTSQGLPIPVRPIITRQQDWLAWLLYQALYVATAEEIFFRGYIQANVTKALEYWNDGMLEYRNIGLPARRPGHLSFHRFIVPWLPMLVSAGCFALAHVVVQGQIVSVVTFLPGLIMAWLFARTHSLLAPILFHAVANISYGLMAATLT